MNCFKAKSRTKTSPVGKRPKHVSSFPEEQSRNLSHNLLFHVPECTLNLIEEGEVVELAKGVFSLLSITEKDVLLATIIKVGDDVQWPLLKDEPVVKLDDRHYLFTLPIKDGDPLNYGVTFSGQFVGHLNWLDSFLQENCCFSGLSSSGPNNNPNNNELVWKDYAPRIEDYNGVLAKAIAGGTGHLVRGIFYCSNAYANQIQNGGQATLSHPPPVNKNGVWRTESCGRNGVATKNSNVNASLKRAKKLSAMTEKLSKQALDGIGIASGSVMAPLVQSQAGKAFLSTGPAEVLLASLDALNKVFDAVEVAEKQAFSATAGAATRMVSDRFGESAGEATGDVLATAEYAASTAWNIFKIRKALTPTKAAPSGAWKAALRYK